MLLITSLIAKLIYFFIKLLRLGSGYTWPGHLALRMHPVLLQDPALLPSRGIILISGTNGKTTTSKFISHGLWSKGFRVLTNDSGANLANGIASALLLNRSFFRKDRFDYCVFEVDEFALPSVLKEFPVLNLVLLNLSRDQLDRYGETDIILERWEEALTQYPPKRVIYDKSFDYFKHLKISEKTQPVDFSFFADIKIPQNLSALYHPKNIQAALTCLSFLGVDPSSALKSFENFTSAYGRGELVSRGEKSFHIFLAKNPASLNHNLSMLIRDGSAYDTLLFILNDGIPDGRDVSWIYDVDASGLAEACAGRELYVTGSRCFDMAVRLDYAGCRLSAENINPKPSKILSLIENSSRNKDIAVLPNYSAMLEIRQLLVGRKIL